MMSTGSNDQFFPTPIFTHKGPTRRSRSQKGTSKILDVKNLFVTTYIDSKTVIVNSFTILKISNTERRNLRKSAIFLSVFPTVAFLEVFFRHEFLGAAKNTVDNLPMFTQCNAMSFEATFWTSRHFRSILKIEVKWNRHGWRWK